MTTYVRRLAGTLCCGLCLGTAALIVAAADGAIDRREEVPGTSGTLGASRPGDSASDAVEHTVASAFGKAPRAFSGRPLTPEQRGRLDRQALDLPEDEGRETAVRYHSGVAGWLVARTPLPVDEEVRRAAAVHRAVLVRWRSLPTPDAAQAVLDRLVQELPGRMRPPPLRFSLTVLDAPQPRAFTAGGGFLYITKPYLDTLLEEPESGPDRLAFVLAREIGHVALEHARRAYQLVALYEMLQEEQALEAAVDRPRLKQLLDAAVRTSGGLLTLVHTRKQIHEADLFALHLCRNAGFDPEAALDVLRAWAAAGQPAAGSEPPDIGPEQAAADFADGAESPAQRPAALARLRRLLLEHHGIVEGAQFGLFEWDRETGLFTKLDDGALAAAERVVVFVHGLKSRMDIHVPLMEHVTAHAGLDGVRFVGFQYPADDSLARSGRFLQRELDRAAGIEGDAGSLDRGARLDFVAHSAGGLVVRFHTEIEEGGFRKAVFHGTPHAGSHLAELRYLLELSAFLGDLRLGYPQALENAITDGDGQIGSDLQPDSLFLRYLNRAEAPAERYFLFRGRALSRASVFALQAAIARSRGPLKTRVLGPDEPGVLRRGAARWIDRFELPEEVTRGDLAVSLESAALRQAARLETVAANHVELPRHPEVMEMTAEILAGPQRQSAPAGAAPPAGRNPNP